MLTVDELKNYTILFVDDEDKARKYFSRAYSEEFTVITAESVDEAISLLAQYGDSVGLLITDQRMPGKQGVDLLKHARVHYPNIVRVLTTAFTNLDDAIEAVNRGEIFRYITKPWDIRSLKAELISGLSFYHVARERDLLLREKLSIWQRMKLTNFARDLIVMAGSLSTVKNALPAIDMFLTHYSQPLIASTQRQDFKIVKNIDPWLSMQQDIQRQLELDGLMNAITSPLNRRDDENLVDINTLIGRVTEKLSTKVSLEDVALIANDRAFRVNASFYERFVDTLVKYVSEIASESPDLSVRLSFDKAAAENIAGVESESVILTLALSGYNQLVSYEAVEGLAYILALYFLTYDQGGRIEVMDSADNFQLKIILPTEASQQIDMELSRDWLEEVFANYENWGEYSVN